MAGFHECSTFPLTQSVEVTVDTLQTPAIELKSGDVFLLTSDGITEASVTTAAVAGGEPTRSMLQQEGLWQLLIQEPGSINLDNLLAYIRADNPVQEDDQTILSLEVL